MVFIHSPWAGKIRKIAIHKMGYDHLISFAMNTVSMLGFPHIFNSIPIGS